MLTEYLARWKEVREGTEMLARVLPDDKLDFRPHPDMMPLGELCRHIPGADYFMMNRMLGRSVEIPEHIKQKQPLGRQAFLEALTATDRMIQSLFSELTEADLSKDAYVSADGIQRSLGWVIFHMLEHEIHHRSQLKMYLKLLGADTSSLKL